MNGTGKAKQRRGLRTWALIATLDAVLLAAVWLFFREAFVILVGVVILSHIVDLAFIFDGDDKEF